MPTLLAMPHIHTGAGQHDHTASAFVIRVDTPEPTIMLHRHKKLGYYLQFGGHIELDETPWQTVLHEIQEESGYTPDQLTLLQPKSRIKKLTRSDLHPYPVCYNTHRFNDNHFHTDIDFAFITKEPPKHEPSPNESNDIKLFNRQQLLDLLEGETIENVKEIGLFIFDECLKNWERIPAAQWSSKHT